LSPGECDEGVPLAPWVERETQRRAREILMDGREARLIVFPPQSPRRAPFEITSAPWRSFLARCVWRARRDIPPPASPSASAFLGNELRDMPVCSGSLAPIWRTPLPEVGEQARDGNGGPPACQVVGGLLSCWCRSVAFITAAGSPRCRFVVGHPFSLIKLGFTGREKDELIHHRLSPWLMVPRRVARSSRDRMGRSPPEIVFTRHSSRLQRIARPA
jgi:hypothetical protein